jgi:histidinol dehydrogenase
MKRYINPPREQWKEILKRPYVDNTATVNAVQLILNAVQQHGDEAVWSFTKKFDGVELKQFGLTEEEREAAAASLPQSLKEAIVQARDNVAAFHKSQLKDEGVVETLPGVRCWRRSVGMERVGLYIPGGTAPLFSTVLMLGVPAQLAGCREIILCTPAAPDGSIHPAIIFAAGLVGVTKLYKIGGAQAIAAMAFGTATIPAVDKIFGPGNQYVTAAKQLVQMQGVAIDMPAGPSEVCVLADSTANPAFVAADLLSQAEHGADSQVVLIGDSEELVDACLLAIREQLQTLPRKELAAQSLANSKAIIVSGRQEAIALANAYAAEHLILSCAGAEEVAEAILHAGSVFIGNYSPESVGDYASGTNHTLPTNGFARAYSGVSVDSFVRKITYQQLSAEGLKGLAPTVMEMAKAEGLEAHARAVSIRLQETTDSQTASKLANREQ